MVSVYLFSLIVTIIAIGSFSRISRFSRTGSFEAGAIQIGCSEPDERCLPVRHCPPVFKRVVKGEHKQNITFKKELARKICQPAEPMDTKTHICCPRPQIECLLNGKKGACLLRERCPTLQATTEKRLIQSIEKNLCYVHEKRNYFCCTDALCASNKKLCDQEGSTKQHSTSAFPNCTGSSGAEGSLVPRILCSEQTSSVRNTDDNLVCCIPPSIDRLISHPNAAKLAQSSCGTTGLVDKIQNGTFAQRAEFPWMAKLVYNSRAVCGGTLIHPLYVLTARHCIIAQLVKVQLGIHDLQAKSKCSSPASDSANCLQQEVQEISILKSFKHDLFDAGLLRLVKPATVEGDFVRPICLPIYSSLLMHLPPTVTISGWGLTEKNKLSNVLLKASTPVLIDEEECNKDYIICIGGVNHSNHCPGDSGGPYQALGTFGGQSGRRFVQYGIIKGGSAHCSNPDRASQGVMVGYVIDWILDRMEL